MLNILKNKKVFVTGHTGVKGVWLTNMLLKLGAEVKGYALNPDNQPNHFYEINNNIENDFNDIRDFYSLYKSIKDFQPDIIYHMAAQPLVRESYRKPFYTYDVNVKGTLNLLEIFKELVGINNLVVITTDKVYKSKEQDIGYVEEDELHGFDPYSNSKSIIELMVDSYRNSVLNKTFKKVITVRAGNIICGGDWCKDRIVPDIIRSIYEGDELEIRSPNAVRPFTHVLDICYGYILAGGYLLENDFNYLSTSWNFGSKAEDKMTILELLKNVEGIIPDLYYDIHENDDMHETKTLLLNSDKARDQLSWSNLLDKKDMVKWTIQWYKEYYEKGNVITEKQIDDYFELVGE